MAFISGPSRAAVPEITPVNSRPSFRTGTENRIELCSVADSLTTSEYVGVTDVRTVSIPGKLGSSDGFGLRLDQTARPF